MADSFKEDSFEADEAPAPQPGRFNDGSAMDLRSLIDSATAPKDDSPRLERLRWLLDKAGKANLGGAVGGAVAGARWPLVAPVVAPIGGFVGHLLDDGPRLTPEQQGMRPPGLDTMARGSLSDAKRDTAAAPIPEYTPDYGAAAVDGAMQGVTAGGMRLLGAGAELLGWPRAAAFLSGPVGITRNESYAAAAPGAVRAVSPGAISEVYGASKLSGAAAQERASILASEASKKAALASGKGEAEAAIRAAQGRMQPRVAPIAKKNAEFIDKLDDLMLPDAEFRKAFASAAKVPEAARSQEVRAAQQALAETALPQKIDSGTIRLATKNIAKADAAGATGAPARYAADAAGLRALGGEEQSRGFLSSLLRLPARRMTPGDTARVAAGMSGEAGGVVPGTQVAPQITTELIAKLLRSMQGDSQ